MNRRQFLAGTTTGALLAAGGGAIWLAGEAAPIPAFADLKAADLWIKKIARNERAKTIAGWPLAHVFEHAAQSVEFSMDGYPQAKPAWFRHTAGALAFALFNRRGTMGHDLEEPIPGAPALAETSVATAASRLRSALARFDAHTGALAPHFAYGALDKSGYMRAHLLHLADHARRIRPAPIAG